MSESTLQVATTQPVSAEGRRVIFLAIKVNAFYTQEALNDETWAGTARDTRRLWDRDNPESFIVFTGDESFKGHCRFHRPILQYSQDKEPADWQHPFAPYHTSWTEIPELHPREGGIHDMPSILSASSLTKVDSLEGLKGLFPKADIVVCNNVSELAKKWIRLRNDIKGDEEFWEAEREKRSDNFRAKLKEHGITPSFAF